ncbi:hypothetical protein [Arthrobacter cryoconiti]|uniref:Uncharacterized protein n=1 Tax=Arthrobacter cryoconiti TaxID=748907 RepID=A0ABV8QWE7_9MICC|nr:hypothetical protein [Arthrobacter cryoconiti]MCC9068813.1 hypothetical protein [Arthrobacter cryoconiti]
MTTDNENPEEENPNKELPIIPGSARYFRDLTKREAQGEDLQLSPDEHAKFDEYKLSSTALYREFDANFKLNLQPLLKFTEGMSVNGILGKNYVASDFLKGISRPSYAPQPMKIPINPMIASTRNIEESMAEMAADREEAAAQRLQDSDNLKLMAAMLVEMERGRKQGEAVQEKQSKFNSLVAKFGILLAFGALAVPFVIETIKGWA